MVEGPVASINRPGSIALVLLLTVITLAGCIGQDAGAPRAVAKVTPDPDDPYSYRFDASGSTGNGLRYHWEFGDRTNASDPIVDHTYEHGDGTYEARLIVEDAEGTPDIWTKEIEVGSGENAAPVALFSPGARNYALEEPVRVDASASVDPEGDPLLYRWDFNHLMDGEEYQAFRSEKARTLADGSDEDDGTDASYDNDAIRKIRETLASSHNDASAEQEPTQGPSSATCLGPCPESGGPGEGNPSLFSHTAETEEPVYTLEEGYPEATVFYIRLQAYDVKGAHEEIVSEEIWPVEAWEETPDSFVSDSENGTFDFGGPAELTDAINDSGLGDDEFQYEYTWEFEIDWPVAPAKRDGTDFTPGGEITLRWDADVDYEAGTTDSCQRTNGACMEMTVTPPNGETLGMRSLDQGLRVELDGNNDYVEDNWETPWKVHIIARDGIEISWEIDYWMHLDTNPFASLEDDTE